VFKNKGPRRLFAPYREEVTGGWSKLLHSFPAKHYLNDQIKEDGIDGAYSTHAGENNAYKVLVPKSEGKTPLRRPIIRIDYCNGP
jgi:hypothetical protein